MYLPFVILVSCNNSNRTTSREIDSTKEQTIKSTDTIDQNNPTALQDFENLIVPGEQVGKVRLGENVSALEVLGLPDKSDAAMGKAWLYWNGQRDEHNNLTELDVYTTYKDSTMQEKTVQQIRTTSSQFATANHIHVYSSLKEIEQAFPEIKKLASYNEDGRSFVIYDAVAKGIAFEMTKAGEQRICTGIIVHEKNKEVTQVYIMLHPDMKRLRPVRTTDKESLQMLTSSFN